MKRVLWLQWRGLLIVTVMIVDVIFFLVVFLHLDASTVLSSYNIHRATPWVLCLIENPTLPQLCFQDGQEFLVTEGTLNAILILLSVVGLICFCLMVRFDFFIGWGNFIRGRDNIDTTGSAAWAEMFVEEDDDSDEHDEKHASNVYETGRKPDRRRPAAFGGCGKAQVVAPVQRAMGGGVPRDGPIPGRHESPVAPRCCTPHVPIAS